MSETASAGSEGYRQPPPSIREVLHAKSQPMIVLDAPRDHLVLLFADRYPSIADLAAPMLRLAGVRLNPRTNGPHLQVDIEELQILDLRTRQIRTVELPTSHRFSPFELSPVGGMFALQGVGENGIELWVGDLATARVRPIPGVRLSAAFGDVWRWMPDGKSILCLTIPADRGLVPEPPRVPKGPVIQETSGPSGPIRTFQDLLQNEHDEQLLDYYLTSQMVRVDLTTDTVTPIGPPGIFDEIDPSPDGQFLCVDRIHRPYSYLLPISAFPHDIEIWTLDGTWVRTVASLPLEDQVPIEGVPTGPRMVHWRAHVPASLVWVEALDQGDPRIQVPHRDRVVTLTDLVAGEPREVFRVEHRFAGLLWGASGDRVLFRDYERDRRWSRTFSCSFDAPGEPKLIWSRSIQDRYGDPGSFLLRTLPDGTRVLWESDGHGFLVGAGSTPRGDRPFLDRFCFETGQTERLFQCQEGEYEVVIGLLDREGTRFITRHETSRQPPNYYVRDVSGSCRDQLTHFDDPTPQLRRITRQIVTYERADGVSLSFTLFLPPDHQPGQALPTILWAYPLEYTSADNAGQVTGSPDRFTMFSGPSHLFLLLQGYAVLDGATMPVVGDPETANNSFIDQVVASARAAIEKAAAMGVTDRDRVAIGGHSYGAFMTANLLAHSDLFRAGIARSGAFNRTLTPFGFQSERRTLWEATDVYARISPFQHAHRIKAPLLLIHGMSDNNPGTFPLQSERMYQAIRGNGGSARLVLLPHESHGYAAQESIEHVLAEMIEWLDRHLKPMPSTRANSGPANPAGPAA